MLTYRLSKRKKEAVGENLVAFMESKDALSQDAATFIGNWILSGPEEKTKAYYDVWDFVLRNYMPETRPLLFRSCARLVDEKIVSFTGKIYCAHRFSAGKGFLVICDTDDVLLPPPYANRLRRGEYHNTFFPVAQLLQKESKSTKSKFSQRLIDNYVKEDEYIMRVSLDGMYFCKWRNHDRGGGELIYAATGEK